MNRSDTTLQNKAQNSSLALRTGKLLAVLLLDGQPGLPGTGPARQWDEKREKVLEQLGKKPVCKPSKMHLTYHAVGWFAGMCLHLLPVLLRFLHDIFVGHSWEQKETGLSYPASANKGARGREGLQDILCWGSGTPVSLRAPNSPTGNVRTWVVRGPDTTTECVQAQDREAPLSSTPTQARQKGKSSVPWAHLDLAFCSGCVQRTQMLPPRC